MKLFKKAKKGFTLVELVVVIAVIAILAAVSVGAYFGVTESAKNSQCEQEAKALHTSITLVANDPKYDTKMDQKGLTVGDDFATDIEAVTGIAYTFEVQNTKIEAVNEKYKVTRTAATSQIVFITIDNDAEYDAFAYFLDDSHYRIVSVTTGEFLPNA